MTMRSGKHEEFMALYEEFRASKTWEELNLDNSDFATMLGISQRAFYRWKKGEVPIPLMAIFLLRLLVKQEKDLRRELA